MRHTLALLLLILSVSCTTNKTTDPTLKLYVFDCGRLRLDTVTAFGLGDHETNVRELSVPCYMVEHPAGRLLWDGGLPSVVAQTPGWHRGDGGFFSQRLDRPLAEQLADMGLGMDSFDFMAYSHSHWDHMGVANEVQNATLLMQQAEYEAAFAPEITAPGGFDRALYNRLAQAQRIILEGEHDVFGDGRVRIIAAPGHTPGHQVLLIDLEQHGPVVLGGDLYHFRFNRVHRRVPRFNFNAEQTLESMTKIDRLLAATNAQLWIQHELAWFEQLKQAPQFYQ